jgi:hypothetical protein
MRIHHLYADEHGESHFRDIEVPWVQETPGGKLSERMAATGFVLREVPPIYGRGWSPAPLRQYMVNLDAAVRITASDGESRIIGAGEILLVEDTTGTGHLAEAVEDKIRHCLYLLLE